MSKIKVAVVGGGAAGMFAAHAAAHSGAEVSIFEKNDRVGKKILSTGNGRCNLTNINAAKENYHGEDVRFMKDVIDSFWVRETLTSFCNMGLLYKTEDGGKVYPYSNSAATVLDVLRKELERAGVTVACGFEVQRVKKEGGKFCLVSYDGKKAYADRVIVATGGKACPSSGSVGGGYEILSHFGHSITELFPALVQIKLKDGGVRALNGLKIDGTVSVKKGKRVLGKEEGEILFTNYGLSGPAVFALSRLVGEQKNCVAEIDMMPEYDFASVLDMLFKNRRLMSVCEDLFCGILPKRIGQTLIKESVPVKLTDEAKKLSDADLKKIAARVKAFALETDGTLSWNNAQVTAGGVRTAEFEPRTLESKLAKGIYAAGEVLDIDGDCGGYNLQWAWASGYAAGKSAAGEVTE